MSILIFSFLVCIVICLFINKADNFRNHPWRGRGRNRWRGRGRNRRPRYDWHNPYDYETLRRWNVGMIPYWHYPPVNVYSNPGCDYKSCGGYCTPYNSKCCGGTNSATCSLKRCKDSQLCN